MVTECTGSKEPGGYDSSAPGTTAPSWYKEVVFYQIYPRSFLDTNGDGIGDLQGIVRKLDYLEDLGIGGIWLNPTYPTQNADLGYDITDFRAVNPEFGTAGDLQELIAEAHARNIRILLDLAINDTSIAHPWFSESRSSRDSPKRDWYLWSPTPGFRCLDTISLGNPFGESRWELDPSTGEYYYHQFYAAMPDLNFRNAAVRNELLDIVRSWLGQGVDGFRIDAASFYVEDPSANLCMNQPETHRFFKDLRAVLDSYPARATVGEVLPQPPEMIAYLGDGSDELHMFFNFTMIPALLQAALGGNVSGVAEVLEQTYARLPEGGHYAIVTGNHDLPRSYSLVGRETGRAKLLATLQMTLPGTPFIYYGEELGIESGDQVVVDWRDMARTPMQWDGSEQAGFSESAPWIRLAGNHANRNVESEMHDPESLLQHYRQLIRLRNALPALRGGTYLPLDTGDPSVLAFLRSTGAVTVLAAINTGDRPASVTVNLRDTRVAAGGSLLDVWSGVSLPPVTQDNADRYPLDLPPRSAVIAIPAE